MRSFRLEKAEEEASWTLCEWRDLESILIPTGEFTMGSTDEEIRALNTEHNTGWFSNEAPQHTVYLDAYYIGKYPVTNVQYGEFMEETGHREPDYWDDDEFNAPDQPVVGVSWDDAVAFCRWLSERTGKKYRLPTEAEWEKAARGTDRRTYPWGEEELEARFCNFNFEVGHTTPVGRYPDGVSPYGCLDMAGNVWEWVNSKHKPYPYDATDGREVTDDSGDRRVLRGGSWNRPSGSLRTTHRSRHRPDRTHSDHGFRCSRTQ